MVIFGTLDQIEKQVIALKEFPKVADHLRSLLSNPKILELETGASFTEYLSGKDIYVVNQAYETKGRPEKQYESHRSYIDVQFMISNEEFIEVRPVDDLTVTSPYREDGDCVLYNNKVNGNVLHMKPGMVAVFFPGDGHMPGISVKSPLKVIKSVVKYSVKLL